MDMEDVDENMADFLGKKDLRSTGSSCLLRRFLQIQQRRALAYSNLKLGFTEYLSSGEEVAYQQLSREITMDFNGCSKQVLEIESLLKTMDYDRHDLARILSYVQELEKQKLNLTATIQVLKMAGRPSERQVGRKNLRSEDPMERECVPVREIREARGMEVVEADCKYDNALRDAVRDLQRVVESINDHLEEIKYEVEDEEESLLES